MPSESPAAWVRFRKSSTSTTMASAGSENTHFVPSWAVAVSQGLTRRHYISDYRLAGERLFQATGSKPPHSKPRVCLPYVAKLSGTLPPALGGFFCQLVRLAFPEPCHALGLSLINCSASTCIGQSRIPARAKNRESSEAYAGLTCCASAGCMSYLVAAFPQAGYPVT